MVPIPEDFTKSVATVFFKDNNYWIYHRNTIESAEEEKANPGEKLWLCMKHMSQDPEYSVAAGEGYKLQIGDTIKFGRVRYKVIMMHNEKDGLQEYTIYDRFQKSNFQSEQRVKYGKSASKSKKRRSNSGSASTGNVNPGTSSR